VGVQVKLRDPWRIRAIPERYAVVIHYEEALYQVYGPLYTVMVTYPYVYMMYIVSPLAGLGGGISWRPPTLQRVLN